MNETALNDCEYSYLNFVIYGISARIDYKEVLGNETEESNIKLVYTYVLYRRPEKVIESCKEFQHR